jgi:CRISPR/Cas system-associated endoribonuclease Cas2
MDEKHRSVINTPNDMPNPWLNHYMFLLNMTDLERERFERVFSSILEMRVAPEEVSAMEERLEEIITHEKYIRTLRQEYESKLRLYKLREAIASLRMF